MIAKKWQRKNNDWWRGQKVVVISEIRNDHFCIAPGTICIVKRKYKGLHIESEECPHCNVKVSISNAQYGNFVLYDEVVVVEHEAAIERAQKEFKSTRMGRCVVGDNGRYLVLPHEIGQYYIKDTVYSCGSF